ncbi:MAG: DUF4105 domain-containing protein [Acetobacter sp.]|nr:DUF4105 domain-containing protein [Acetobacter sp.]
MFGRLFLFFCVYLAVSGGALADNLAWQKLLHYQEKGGGYVSLVENEAFFLTEEGRYNSEAEYAAAVLAFNEPSDRRKCDFPARFMLLKKMGVVAGTLAECEEYQKFLSDVQPKAVTMLFTNAYMSNPSSLFGHTLFRIDTKRKGTQLLAHGANFGADTGDESGVLFALKGLWGGYYGTFGVRPYYDVINLYNNIENRDIWEYQLNLSDEELELFTAHMWEMKHAKIRYYFLNKNCSYVLLSMLEAVRPSLVLTNKFEWSAAPLATLKAVNEVPNLVAKVNYRPSRQSKLKYRAKQMNKQQRSAFQQIIRKDEVDLNELNEEEKADVLETAYQYVQYRYVEGDLELVDYRKKSFALLRERSKIANQRQYFDELKEGENPVYAHQSAQIGAMLGVRNGDVFQEVSFKPAYTTLLDDSFGMLKGAEINMFETTLRHYDKRDKYVLEELNLLNIKSLSGADMMFTPFSYDIGVALKRIFDAKSGEEHTAFVVKVGAGQSYALTENTLLYVLTTPNTTYNGGLSNNGYMGLSFQGGIYYNNGRIRLNASAEQNFTTSTVARGQTYQIEAAYGLTRDVSFYGKYKMFNSDYNDEEEISFGVKVGF